MYQKLTKSALSSSLIRRFEAKVDRGAPDACWPWRASRAPFGYGRITARVDGHYRSEYAHRIAYLLATEEDIPAGMVVMHLCDNPPCCNPAHLRLGTFSENAQDRNKKNRGWIPPLSVEIPESQMAEMVRLYQHGETFRSLERRFHISALVIWRRFKRAGVATRKRGPRSA